MTETVDASPRHLFICGLHRSGTTPLHRLLRVQDGVTGFVETGEPMDEGQHVQSAIPPARAFGGAGHFAFDPRATLTAMDADEGTADDLRRAWERRWEPVAGWRLEKSPPNIVRGPFLQAVFPRSSFVYLTRHPVAVSLATKKWTRTTSLATLVEHWLIAHETARSHSRLLDRVRWVAFEDFVTHPAETVRACLELSKEHPVADVDAIRSGANDVYFDRWTAMRRSSLRSIVTTELIGRLEHRVRMFGYSLVDLDRTPETRPS